MKQNLLTFVAIFPVVGLCVVAFAILENHFWAGLGLLVVAAILATCMYLRIGKKVGL
jgi:hypothetical protein